MTKYALIVNGVVDTIAFQPQEDGFVEVPDWVFGGFTVNPDGTFTNPNLPQLAAVQSALKAAIDTAAEVARQKYITPGSGQAMTYMQKADEASRYLAASDPVAADYPLLSAEVGVTAPTIGEVAAVVNGAFIFWQQKGAAIEAARLGTKAAIDAAATAEEAQAATEAVVWP